MCAYILVTSVKGTKGKNVLESRVQASFLVEIIYFKNHSTVIIAVTPLLFTLLGVCMFIIIIFIPFVMQVSRLTIVSREAKKQHTRPLSELFTRSTALKFANAPTKPP